MIFNIKETRDAKTLEGHGASYFASVAELFATVKSYKNLDFNNAVSTGIYVDGAKPSSAGASNYPNDLTGILVVFGGLAVSQRYATHSGIVYERSYFPSLGWTPWKEVFTKAGGTINGNLRQFIEQDHVLHEMQNGKRHISFTLHKDGTHYLYDNTNYKMIYRSEADGTNTFNGTASGNLPLTGGKTTGAVEVVDSGQTPLVANTSGGQTPCYVGFYNTAGFLGRLGFGGSKIPVVHLSDGSIKELCHTGNSAKTVISSTAPSDTTALWIDTSA